MTTPAPAPPRYEQHDVDEIGGSQVASARSAPASRAEAAKGAVPERHEQHSGREKP